jgi:hypothetical protein
VARYFKLIFLFYLLSVLGGCKAVSPNTEESDAKSIGYRKWALLFHEYNAPYYQKRHHDDPDAYKGKKFIFALCQRTAPSYKTILYRKTATQPGCVSALKRKDDPTKDLIFEVSYEKIDRTQKNNWIRLQGERILDLILQGAQFGGAIVITVAPPVVVGAPTAAASAPVGGAAGIAAGAAVLAWSAAKGIAWATMFHVGRSKTTHKWSETDEAAAVYYRHLFRLDDGKEIQNIVRKEPSKQFGYILNWLAKNFDGVISPEFRDAQNDVARGDPNAFL